MRDRTSQERVTTIERLLDEVESLPDAKSRELATELVAELLELYGEGLARMMELASATGEANGLASELADDELVSHLLLVHGLHPIPVEARVQSALDEVRPYLDSHGGDVELLAVDDTVVRLRMEGSCSGCPSSAMTLKLAIEQAIAKSAPEIESVEAEGTNDPVPPAPALLQIEIAGGGATESSNGSMNGPSEAGWTSAGAIPAGAEERGALVEISSQPVLICSVDGAPYAYRPGCPVCDASLEGAALRSGELICPDCEKRFDVRRAGRCLDAPQLHLEPIPLLAGDDGGVKLALGAGVVT
jgi:Fe-S cluster biogenesis protein NfuA/nitrite reductase/ring-hydroxylating ferredoxin subunit